MKCMATNMPRTKSNHRLRCVHVLISNVSYCHALGRRISTTTREGAIRHVYDGVQCIADIDGQGDVVASYTWGVGIDNLLAIRTGGETYYPLTDVQGTIWGYVDANNSIVAQFEYDAWGNTLSATSSVPALARNRYRFQCREWSAATGLVNFRARWYDPVTGRWISKDPIGLSGGLNLYVFCGNNPIGFRDPFGKKRKKPKDDDKGGRNVFDSDVVNVIKKMAGDIVDGVVDRMGSPKMSTALSATETIANGADAIPGAVAVSVARDGIKQIENMAETSGAIGSSEDGLKALENIEKNVRSALNGFNKFK